MGILEKGAVRIHFEEAGSGFPLLLIAGGGGVGIFHGRQQPQISPAVNDLQILDNNQQALEQVDQLLQDDSPDDNEAPPS